ncbi:MAG TPA: Fe2+-dependent dioxygenase [Gammaproteobacteria bacterium]|nr:Fe2+-dependent dioxygenase [Gammaproteobacteria bacterium]
MLIRIPALLAPEQVTECRTELERADWTDGRDSAGYLSAGVKDNTQLPEGGPVARKLGELILRALDRNPLFTSAALPFKVLPPFFNRYAGGQSYGRHIDGAIRQLGGTARRVRTDLAATVFLTPAEDYDGGELVVDDTFGPRSVKLPAGDMVLYPGTSVHRVEPVTRGTRLAAFFWIQSHVREDSRRTILFELDTAIQRIAADVPRHPAVVDLAGVYHNLLRTWADA